MKTKTKKPSPYAYKSKLPILNPENLEPHRRSGGRPTILESLGLTVEQIVSCYKNSTSEREAAEKLKITVRTLRKYLYKGGLKPSDNPHAAIHRGREAGTTRYPSVVFHYIRSKHGIIPRSTKAMSEESGIAVTTIEKFLVRRKKYALDYLLTLGLLREVENKRIVTTKGSIVKTEQIATSDFKVDRYDLSISLRMLLRSGIVVHARMSFREYQELFARDPANADADALVERIERAIPGIEVRGLNSATTKMKRARVANRAIL